MFIKVLILTIFGLYFIGVAINAYLQFNSEDIDWDEVEKEIEEEEVDIENSLEDNQPFMQYNSENIEEWSYVKYSNQKKPKLKTGKDLELEINK